MSVKKIHLFPSEESYVANSGSVEADDLALVPLNLSYNSLRDKAKAHITTTWHSGTSWYRKWSDGWIEQGGYNEGGSDYGDSTVTLPTPFAGTNYSVFVQNWNGNWDYGSTMISRTNSSYFIRTRFGKNFHWHACGY